MNEAEWWGATRPLDMMEHLLLSRSQERFPDHTFRRFACACLRCLEPRLSDRRSRQALLVAERYTEGLADRRALATAHRAAREAVLAKGLDAPTRGGAEDFLAAEVAAEVSGPRGTHAAREVCQQRFRDALARAGAPDPCELLRELFGNPFRAPALPAGWRRFQGGLIAQLAQDVYAGQKWADLPVLADALEEAGCADPDVLGHCRGPAAHRRGCWVVELLRGDE
jgi:hypothetical protein